MCKSTAATAHRKLHRREISKITMPGAIAIALLLAGCSASMPGRDDAMLACASVSIAGEEVVRLGEGQPPTWSSQQFQRILGDAIDYAHLASSANEEFMQLGLISRQLERKVGDADPEFVIDLLSLELECDQLGMYG